MNILNIYFSSTGNTVKVANTIGDVLRETNHRVDTMEVTKDMNLDILPYDFIFMGSGVYEWLPGKPLVDFLTKLRRKYAENGSIKPASPKITGKKAVVYCTYGGVHTGINEAIPAVKYMGQLFDHLGFDVIAEWYIVGEYHGKLKKFSKDGRLGNIEGRPNEADLLDVAEKVRGILLSQF
ncbi:MAG: flavodoxin [Desulfobacterium sp.]|nr:flavodoxin [Desulfobacterium sp.]MBU3948405.1 flavodoxin [Pseudomonadota bacterium]MBU4037159.1 flavodoxin [Pseudomonadota bacterium]